MLSRKGVYYLTEDGRFMPLHYLKIVLAGCVLTILVASVAIFVSNTLNPAEAPGQTSHHNALLTLQKQLNTLEEKLASLSASDHQLRLAVNLPVVSEEEKTMGTGGNRSRTLYGDETSSAHLLAMTGKKIERLGLKIEQQKKSYKNIRTTWNNNQALFAAVPALKPIDGKITSTFGKRLHPVYRRVLFHEGIDFSAKTGTNVYAPGNGVVISTGYNFGYGKKIVIDHGFGYKTVYAHLSRSLVRKGQKVTRGDVIALSGNTGISTGPHLHYEVHKNNRKINPSAYFFDDFAPESFLTVSPVSKQNDSNS